MFYLHEVVPLVAVEKPQVHGQVLHHPVEDPAHELRHEAHVRRLSPHTPPQHHLLDQARVLHHVPLRVTSAKGRRRGHLLRRSELGRARSCRPPSPIIGGHIEAAVRAADYGCRQGARQDVRNAANKMHGPPPPTSSTVAILQHQFLYDSKVRRCNSRTAASTCLRE
jgi:hypothetical protein